MVESPRRGSLLVIFLTVFIDLLGFGMVMPLLPIYGKQFDASYATLGLLMASFSAMQFLFAPLWGRLSDRVGRRPVLMLGLAGSVVFYTLFGVATVWQSLAGLFIARIGAGIAGATISTAQAYIADTHVAGEPGQGDGPDRGGVRLGIHVWPAVRVRWRLRADAAAARPRAPAIWRRPCRRWPLSWRCFKLPESLDRSAAQRGEALARRAGLRPGDENAVDRAAAGGPVHLHSGRLPISKRRCRCCSKARRTTAPFHFTSKQVCLDLRLHRHDADVCPRRVGPPDGRARFRGP